MITISDGKEVSENDVELCKEDSSSLEKSERREVCTPTKEVDVPPSDTINTLKEVSFSETKELWKDIKNFNFLYFIIVMLCILYIIDLIATKGNSGLANKLFDTLNSVLLIVAGYIFGKHKS